jgi:transglutaminase-like putative cysteine protease
MWRVATAPAAPCAPGCCRSRSCSATNDQLADASYVELAHGRDYADVPPLTGVIFAASTGSVMDVAVDMIRVDRG